jgi:hypothetical protein
MSDRFDFEETLTRCWCIIDDLKELSEHFIEHNITDTDTIHNHIFGLATVYDVRFNKLWDLFESVFMEMVRKNKMLEEECAALREQLGYGTGGAGKNFESGAGRPSLFGVRTDVDEDGFAVIKANKKDKK